MVWGNVLALAFYFLQDRYHVLKLDAASYYVNYVPVELGLGGFLLINAGAFLMLLLILIIPSYTIMRITPSKALRYE
jgi:lipoprotein-releasing system permease protein